MEIQETLRINTLQLDTIWENVQANLDHISNLLDNMQVCDIVVLPEMFTTGFSMNAMNLAEANDGLCMTTVKQWAQKYNAAFVGSFIAKEGDNYYNRGFFVYPSTEVKFYDKRHLFLGGEELIFTSGQKQLIAEYKGWNINLAICYDLRFPVWLRNKNLEYDLLIVIAQWPTNRQHIFETLLNARAIENQCYVCASNRIGSDGNMLKYCGGSQMINFIGKVIDRADDNVEQIRYCEIEKYPLESNREKAPVWRHADGFEIND